MDPVKDAHLLYIAKEGLKAPLPDHWKPCQSKNGEIFYYNLDTQESTFEHPCDNYYRGLYQKEKSQTLNKNKGLGFLEGSNDKKAKPLIPPIKQLPSPMFGQQKKADLPEVSNKSSRLDKTKDPLILLEKTKKLEAYRDKKDKEFQGIKKTLDEEYEKKVIDAQQKHNLTIQDLQYDYSEKTKEEEEKIELEIQKIESSLKQSGKSKENLETSLRKELESQNEKKVENETKRLEEEYKEFELEMERTNDLILKEEMEKIRKNYQEKIDDLDQELESYEKKKESINEFDEEAFLSEYKQSLKQEYEKKLNKEKQSFLQKIELEYQEEMNKEMEEHGKRMEELESKALEIEEKKMKWNEEEAEYKKFLEDEYERKVKTMKEENERKLELEKLLILEKIKDFEQQKRLEVKQEVIRNLEQDLEEDFEEKKKAIEENNEVMTGDEEKINKIHEDLVELKRSLIVSRGEQEEIKGQNDLGTLEKVNKEIEGMMKKKSDLMEIAKEKKGTLKEGEKRTIMEKLKKINERMELMMKMERMMQTKLLE